MLNEIRELEARVLKLDRAIQGFSLAKTVLPALHGPGPASHAEIFSADETLDAMERKIEELARLMLQLTTRFGLRALERGRRTILATQETLQIHPIGNR